SFTAQRSDPRRMPVLEFCYHFNRVVLTNWRVAADPGYRRRHPIAGKLALKEWPGRVGGAWSFCCAVPGPRSGRIWRNVLFPGQHVAHQRLSHWAYPLSRALLPPIQRLYRNDSGKLAGGLVRRASWMAHGFLFLRQRGNDRGAGPLQISPRTEPWTSGGRQWRTGRASY